MKKKSKSLQNCIRRLNKNLENKIICVDLEIYAMHNIKKEDEIKIFYRQYKSFWKKFIQHELDNNKKTSGTKLVKKGNSLSKVATYFTNDALSFSIGHIYNGKILKKWYKTLPQLERPYFLN